MNRKSSFWLRLFNIRIDETATVKNLVLHHFFLGIGIALLLTVAGTYFLSYYPPEYFPIAYMLSSLVMMLVGRMYSYFEHALSMRRLLKAVMLILVLLPVLLRLSFYVDGFPYLPLFIMIGFRIIYLLSNLEFWGLSSIVFDVRQGKRLFGLISSGDVPAKLLGYLSVAWLVPAIGLSNLLWIAAVSFALSLFFLRNILLQPDINLQVRHVHQEHFSDRKLLIGFFGNTYILWLSIMGFLTAACFTFIDFSFLYNVQQQYQTQEELASFLGIFFAVGYTFTMLIKVLFSGRLAEKTGIRFSLLVMPVLLFLFSVGFMFYGSHESTLYTNLLYIGIMSMAVGVAKYSINDPVYLAMFQPLPAHLRLKGHTVIKGFIQPLALGVTGIILWAIFEAHESFSFYLLNQGFILLSLTWIFSIFHSHKLYIKTLATAIRKRFISGSEIALEEKSFASLLRQGLHQGDKEDLVYGITALEQKAPEQLREEIPYLLGIEMTDVRKMVLSVLKKHPWHEFAGTVFRFYKNPAWSELHADAAFYCARAAWPEIAEIFRKEAFRHLESPLRESILAGMLQSGKVEQEQLALEKLKALFRSPDKDDLMLAIAICRREYRPMFREDLLRLLNHELEEVREAAIRCAGMSGDEAFIQHLIDGLLSRPDFSSVLSVSLSQYGDGIFRYLEKIPVHAILDKSWLLPDLIRIAERTSGEHGGRFLFSLMHHARPDLKEKMMDVLSASRYVLNGSEREKLELLLKTEIGFAADLLDGQADKSITPLLREAFDFEYASCLKRVVSIAGLLYNRKIMREAAAAFRNNSKERTANALEVMEQVIPRKTAQVLVILLD
ncbi:MAG: hypothetical protein JNL88_00345, partial [Bacteroidia bacterium]|nr:hypothetical protein [Bacteroidia bacterium]